MKDEIITEHATCLICRYCVRFKGFDVEEKKVGYCTFIEKIVDYDFYCKVGRKRDESA